MHTEQMLAKDLDEAVDDLRDTVPGFARGTQELDPRDLRAPFSSIPEASIDEGALAEIVHDLRSPLATIALELTLLDHRIAAGDDVEARPILARLLHNVDFLDRLTHDLLDGWSSDPARTPRVSTDLRALLETVIARSVSTNDRSRVRLDAPRAVWVQLDDLRIQRVVGNLLSNAVKFSPPRKPIIVRLESHRDHCCVSVIDSGPGVTETEAGFIFDKYRRTHSARLTRSSGLGLYISRKIIEDHHGTIGVESVPGTGSRFFFQLALC